MSDITARIKATCSALETEDLRRSCEELAGSCVQQSKKRGVKEYSLSPPNGEKFQLSSLDNCIAMSAHIPPIFGPIPPKKNGSSAPSQPQVDTAKVNKACEDAGAEGSEAHTKCKEFAQICLQTKKAPYLLPYFRANFKSANLDSCLSNASRLASIQYDTSAPTAEKQADATAQPTKGTHVEEAFAPDGKTKFAIRLAEAGLRLVTDKPITLEGLWLRTYHNGYIKGVRTNILYSVVSLSDGHYRMTSTITSKGGESFGGEKSIEFEARDGKIVDDLAFGIELGEEGNFGNVSSVKIVKL